jgi:ATP-dependent exoDNAse (exonuclease V) beta subunit
MTDIADRRARDEALDAGGSFIIQAPAGSGKTELLTQRFLALLARVEKPEEILAITFTRKAAGEMRDRILTALESAAGDKTPAASHEALTLRLAREARRRDRELGWGVMHSPARLKVMTIDSLHAILSRQMPLLSGAGGALAIADRPASLYREAARRTLMRAGDDDSSGAAARSLLAHLDNRFDRAETMLTGLLARREQWLPRVAGPGRLTENERRQWLEGSIRRQIEAGMAVARRACPADVLSGLPPLADFAARQLEAEGAESPVLACRGLTVWPDADARTLDQWKGLTEILMLKSGKDWRKTVTRTLGFPAGGRRETLDMRALLGRLQGEHGFLGELRDIRSAPDWRYPEGQWEMLNRLLTLLPECAAELTVVMREQGSSDYVAVSAAAHQALSDGDAPTELALSLDYLISPILVDEFQDTSRSQVRLLNELTAGWEAGDGRTLFCVGDPMQSIYGFREAEVGLFLETRRQGRINEVPIESLTLEVNFRSDQGVVDWVNETLKAVMPDQEEPRLGAVTYVPAVAFHASGDAPPLVCHAFEEDDGSAEAACVAEVVAGIRGRDPEADIAVLVRARSHLEHIAPKLKESGIRFQAVDIEPLLERPAIQDLLALTRALAHLADRTAWLAILRAPWCGLSLGELLRVATDPTRTIWEQLQENASSKIGESSRRRLMRLVGTLARAMDEIGRRPLHRAVEGAWLELGGPATLADQAGLEDARRFFERLRGLETAGELDEIADIDTLFTDLYAAPDPDASSRLQLMTIHKAKGLQFDYVLLPGLHRITGGNDKQLLHWMEVPRSDGSADLLLSAVEERGAERDPLHNYLRLQEDKKSAFELGRLLYVAVTRARRQVHLFGSIRFPEDDDERPRAPVRGSLLELLWPHCERPFVESLRERAPPPYPRASRDAAYPRLADDWSLPAPPPPLDWESGRHIPATDESQVEYWWAGRAARAVGTVVHRMLERLADSGQDAWYAGRLLDERALWERMLAEQGLEGGTARDASERVMRALNGILNDETGRWILFGDHDDARCELPVAGIVEGGVVHAIVDRSFVDADGTRWIIDYKTGEHEGADLESYLDREIERYQPQLERYAGLLAALSPGQDIRVGLYFPMHGALRSWKPPAA